MQLERAQSQSRRCFLKPKENPESLVIVLHLTWSCLLSVSQNTAQTNRGPVGSTPGPRGTQPDTFVGGFPEPSFRGDALGSPSLDQGPPQLLLNLVHQGTHPVPQHSEPGLGPLKLSNREQGRRDQQKRTRGTCIWTCDLVHAGSRFPPTPCSGIGRDYLKVPQEHEGWVWFLRISGSHQHCKK